MSDDRTYLEEVRSLAFGDRAWTHEEIEKTRDFLAPWNHNIRLAAGVYTAFCAEWYPEHRVIMQVLGRHLRGPFAGTKMLDLGCLEGYFSLECALHGADVLGSTPRRSTSRSASSSSRCWAGRRAVRVR